MNCDHENSQYLLFIYSFHGELNTAAGYIHIQHFHPHVLVDKLIMIH
jgi:hypothetical protein